MLRKSSSSRRQRRLGQFHPVRELDRNNPQSLRKVLFEITKHRLDQNLATVASELKRALRTRRGRTLHSTLSDESLYNILSDITHIKYYHLEAYARRLKIPVSLIVFYSRLMANQQDLTPQLNEAMLNAYSRIIADARRKLRKDSTDPDLFQIQDLFRWIDLYQHETERAENPSLFPSNDE